MWKLTILAVIVDGCGLVLEVELMVCRLDRVESSQVK